MFLRKKLLQIQFNLYRLNFDEFSTILLTISAVKRSSLEFFKILRFFKLWGCIEISHKMEPDLAENGITLKDLKSVGKYEKKIILKNKNTPFAKTL